MRWALLLAWLGSTVPVLTMIGLTERSNNRKADFVRSAVGRAEGTIVRIEREGGSTLRLVPIVAFSPGLGRNVEFRSRFFDFFSIQPHRYSVNQKVPVVFVPAQPERAEMDDPSLREPDGRTFRRIGLVWMGVMTCLFAGLALFLPRRTPRRAP